MLDVHDPEQYKRYSVKKAYFNESLRCIFKGKLRMQTYINIIKPYLEGKIILNICGENKAHIVAHVSIYNLFPLLFIEFWFPLLS